MVTKMRLHKPTETLKSWLSITEKEIAGLQNLKGPNIDARRDHAVKVRDIIAGELRQREVETQTRAA